MENELSTKTKRSFKGMMGSVFESKKKTAVFVGGVIVTVAIVGLVIAAVTGRLAVVFKNPNQAVVVTGGVCGDGSISEYNEIAANTYIDQVEEMQTKFDSLVTSITKNETYKNDLNCVYMVYQHAYQGRDYATASEMLELTKTLVNEGQMIDMRLQNLAGVASMESTLDSISPIISEEEDFDE